jgi:hypothetical protein
MSLRLAGVNDLIVQKGNIITNASMHTQKTKKECETIDSLQVTASTLVNALGNGKRFTLDAMFDGSNSCYCTNSNGMCAIRELDHLIIFIIKE